MISNGEGPHFGRGPRGLKSGTSMPAICINSRIPASRGLWPLLAARLNRKTNLRRIHASARTMRPKSASNGVLNPYGGVSHPQYIDQSSQNHTYFHLQCTGQHEPDSQLLHILASKDNAQPIGLVPRDAWEVFFPRGRQWCRKASTASHSKSIDGLKPGLSCADLGPLQDKQLGER